VVWLLRSGFGVGEMVVGGEGVMGWHCGQLEKREFQTFAFPHSISWVTQA